MSTTTGSLTTRLRTWLLVAGLTGLLLAAGVLVGRAFLYAFVALAVLMNVAGYWFSDRIALAASRARPLGEAEAPALHQAVAGLASRAGIPMPRLYIANPLPRVGVATLFSTHPPIPERVRRLRGFDTAAVSELA